MSETLSLPCDAMGAEKVAESPLRERARERMTSHDPFVMQQPEVAQGGEIDLGH